MKDKLAEIINKEFLPKQGEKWDWANRLADAILKAIVEDLPEEKEETDYVGCGTYETCRKEGYNSYRTELLKRWGLTKSPR